MKEQEIFFAQDQPLAGGFINTERPASRRVLQEYGGSKSLARKLLSSFDGCKLNLMGGEFNGRCAKSPHLAAYLPPYPLDRANLLGVSAFNNLLPKAFDALLLSGNPTVLRESYIDEAGGIDIGNTHRLAADIAQGDKSGMVVRVVYGATEKMPLRALSYMIPGLVYVENVKRITGAEPQLQLIFATHISASLSKVELQKAREQTAQLAYVGRDYIAEFFPQMTGSILFLEDTPLENGAGETINELTKLVKIYASPQSRAALRAKGENHGAVETNESYGAAHILIQDAKASDILVPLLSDQPEMVDPSVIISIGGKKEKDFYLLRQEVKPYASGFNSVRTLQYFTAHHVPPYYMDREGDLSLDQALAMTGGELRAFLSRVSEQPEHAPVGRASRYDSNYLLSVSDRRGDLVDFLKKKGKDGKL